MYKEEKIHSKNNKIINCGLKIFQNNELIKKWTQEDPSSIFIILII